MNKEAKPPLEESIPVPVFKEEIAAWARRIKVEPKEIHIRGMKRKWASCSSRGRVTFNAELLCQPASFRHEAIVEELLHLRIPNHGKLFKTLKSAYLAQYGGKGE
jgi:hypothetical protein